MNTPELRTDFIHIRQVDDAGLLMNEGGATIAYQIEDGEIHLRVARCHGVLDRFCYEKGRQASAGRLAKYGPEQTLPEAHPRSEQIVNWFAKQYFDAAVDENGLPSGGPIKVEKLGKMWVSTFNYCPS